MKTCLFFIGLLSIGHLRPQTLPSVSKSYSFKIKRHSLVNPNDSTMFRIFYIIGQKKETISGKIYNQFVFSEDSTDVCGYVRFDSASRRVLFVNKNYKKHIEKTNDSNVEKTLFPFFGYTTDTSYLGVLGELYTLTCSVKMNGNIFLMKISPIALTSETSYIEELSFNKGELYPHSIMVFDSSSDRDVIVEAK